MEMIVIFISVIIISYIMGCFNGAQIIGSINGIDIKQSGNKNAGASNTTMVLGWKYGLIVLLIDILKVIVAVKISQEIALLNNLSLDISNFLSLLSGAFVILGHNFPITMNFKGGKGTASVIGLFFAIDWKAALISLIILVATSLILNYLVIGVLAFYASFSIYAFYQIGEIHFIVPLLLTGLFAFMHKENFDRIKNNEEVTIWGFLKKKQEGKNV